MRTDVKILPVIMSGGAGSRLWPLSRKGCAKQFLPLSSEKTMIQETIERFKGPEFLPPVFICNESHIDIIKSQIEDVGSIIVEPKGRNTGPCAMVAAVHAVTEHPEALIVLAPADHVIDDPDAFVASVRKAAPIAKSGYHVTFGMKATHPATGFGYIHQGKQIADGVFEIESFKEKPDEATASEYLALGGYHWNSGIFLFKPSKIIEDMTVLAPDCAMPAQEAYEAAQKRDGVIALDPGLFAQCKAEPIDIALMERTEHGAVLPCEMGWKDVGCFSAYRDLHAEGNAPVIRGDGYVHNSSGALIDTDGPLVSIVGLENVAVIVRDGRVLVVSLETDQDVKKIVNQLKADDRKDML